MGRTKCAATSESLTLKGGNKGKGKDRASHTSPIKTGFDGRIDAPWQRQVAYSLRLPCTLIHTTSNGTEKAPPKNATSDREKVRQVGLSYFSESANLFSRWADKTSGLSLHNYK